MKSTSLRSTLTLVILNTILHSFTSNQCLLTRDVFMGCHTPLRMSIFDHSNPWTFLWKHETCKKQTDKKNQEVASTPRLLRPSMITWCACEYEPQINPSRYPWYLTSLVSDGPSFRQITWLGTYCPGNALHNLLRTHWSSSGWPLYHPCSWLHRHVAPRSTISDIRRMPHPNSPLP